MASYRYFLKNDPVSPLNSGDHILTYNKKESFSLVFDVELEGDLKFYYNNSGFDFKAQEESNKCEEIDLRIEKKCSGIWAIIWEGVFSVAEGVFNDDDCIFTIKPRKKEYVLSDIQINFLDDPIKVYEGGVLGVTATRPGGSGFCVHENCRYFDNFLLFIAKKSNPKINSVVSNFFQINPDGAFYIPGVTNYWSKMAVASISDIQYPIPSNLATRDYISFEEMMNDLYVLFQVQWLIDTNYNLRIEHEIYFEGSLGLNLTQNKYKEFLKKSSKYNYNLDDYPKKETWKIADHSRVCSLTYGGLSSIKKRSNEKVYSTSKIRTDYESLIFGVMGGGGEPITEDGVYLFATDGGATLGEWLQLESSNQNFKLNPDYLVEQLHTYNRPDLYALFVCMVKTNNPVASSGGIILDSLKPTKRQEIISIPLCCGDSFEVKDQVKTDLGIGYVEKASLNLKTEMLSLELKYKIDNCSGFQPSDLSDLDLWLKWNDVVVDTPGGPPPYVTTVVRWNDSSGNNRHADQGNPQFKPIYITPVTGGSPVIFTANYYGPLPDPLAELRHLLTPAFQLFPNKRGTIIILFNEGDPSYPLSFSDGPVLSTDDGGASTYFDLSLSSSKFYSYKESKNLPDNYMYNGLYVLRRGSDVSVDGSFNGIQGENNPVLITNDQPSSLPLQIGCNGILSAAFIETNILNISEIIIYGRYLTDDEIEKIQLYLVKKGIYKLYNT